MKRLKIAFQFWHEKSSNHLSYTSLMGPDKLKLFQDIDLTAIFQSTIRATQTQDLWNQFNKLYNLLHKKKTTGTEFREKAQDWLTSFLAPSQGRPNSGDFIRGMYRVQDLTPYIHVLFVNTFKVRSRMEATRIHGNQQLWKFWNTRIGNCILPIIIFQIFFRNPKTTDSKLNDHWVF